MIFLANIFGTSEDELIVTPITHVSVTVDGIPEVMEIHQNMYQEPAESPPDSPPEQPKRKKGIDGVKCIESR